MMSLRPEEARDHPLHFVLRYRGRGCGTDRLDIDADRINADANVTPADFEKSLLARPPRLRLLDTGEERAQIVVGLEADQVVLTQVPDQVGVVR